MIDQPNSKKQATTGTMTNGSSACSNKPRRHQIPTRAYLPPNHDAARNKIVSPPPDHENESLTPNVVSPEESVAYLGADYPLPSPSPSRIIKIPREDNNDIENRAYEQSECDAATWKMYHRIMDSRRHHQENLPILNPRVVAQIKEEAIVAYLKPLSPPLSGATDDTSTETCVCDRDERAQFITRCLIDVLNRAHKIADGGNFRGVYMCHPTAFSEIASSPQEQDIFAMDR